MRIHSLQLVVVLAAIVMVAGCKKSNNIEAAPTPPTVPSDLPTQVLDGGYMWHSIHTTTGISGKDSSYTVTTADVLTVVSDTEILVRSEINWSSDKQVGYKYTSSNDSEVVYSKNDNYLKYKKQRNLLIWVRYNIAYYGVPGATSKWGAENRKQIDTERRWHYTYEHNMLHTTRENSDTLANAVVICAELMNATSYLSGADSTGSIYEKFIFNNGPNQKNLATQLKYKKKSNEIDIVDYNWNVSYVAEIHRYKTL